MTEEAAHTAKRIFERLRDKHRFMGGIKDYVVDWRQRTQDMFVPLVHFPAKPSASSVASARSTSSLLICLTRTPASWSAIWQRRQKRSATATFGRLHSSAASRSKIQSAYVPFDVMWPSLRKGQRPGIFFRMSRSAFRLSISRLSRAISNCSGFI